MSGTKRRVIIFEKESLLGCIGIVDDGERAVIRAYDSRCGVKDPQTVLSSASVSGFVKDEVRKTTERGWRVVYDGSPNFG